MSINAFTDASTNSNMSTNTSVTYSQELLDSLRSAWEEQQELERLQEDEIFEDELRYREYARQEEEKKQNAIFLETPHRLERQETIVLDSPPVLRRETPQDYIIDIDTPHHLERQDTIVLGPPPVLRRETPEDYLFDPNSFISPDRIHNIQMPGTPVANRTLDMDLFNIRPRRLNFNN